MNALVDCIFEDFKEQIDIHSYLYAVVKIVKQYQIVLYNLFIVGMTEELAYVLQVWRKRNCKNSHRLKSTL